MTPHFCLHAERTSTAMRALGPINSLVLMPWTPDTRYAIGRLDQVFFEARLEMAGGHGNRIFFAYPDIAGRPDWIPATFQNVVAR